jgi:putative transposase
VKGVKRHVLVDTMGWILNIVVLTADIQDRDGARVLLEQAKGCLPRLQKIWADGGYAGALIEWVLEKCHWLLEIVKRSDHAVGFELLPHRWIVERTFGWLNRSRRLSKNYERLTTSSEAMVYLAMLPLMTRRLAKQQTCFA